MHVHYVYDSIEYKVDALIVYDNKNIDLHYTMPRRYRLEYFCKIIPRRCHIIFVRTTMPRMCHLTFFALRFHVYVPHGICLHYDATYVSPDICLHYDATHVSHDIRLHYDATYVSPDQFIFKRRFERDRSSLVFPAKTFSSDLSTGPFPRHIPPTNTARLMLPFNNTFRPRVST